MMFTTAQLRNSAKMDDRDSVYLTRMLARYAATPDGLWLQTLPWRRMNFKWCPAMKIENGVMGCFSPAVPDTVFLVPRPEPEITTGPRSYWIEQLFSVIVHELRHAWQWKRSRIGYFFSAIPGIRNFTLEKDAKNQEQLCGPWLKRWTAEQDFRYAAEHNLAEILTGGTEENENR